MYSIIFNANISHFPSLPPSLSFHRHCWQLYEQELVQQYSHEITTWEEVDYAYISYYTREGVAQKVRTGDEERKEKEKAELQRKILEALEIKKRELLERLMAAHREFVKSVRLEGKELEHSKEISHAFVYSYFHTVPGQMCQKRCSEIM